MTLATLVIGNSAAAREAAIAASIDPTLGTVLILEGLPSPHPIAESSENLRIIRIAPGCLCCIGNLAMRVTLNRVLRHPPARLFIGLTTSVHLDLIRDFLLQPPYDALLTLTDNFRG